MKKPDELEELQELRRNGTTTLEFWEFVLKSSRHQEIWKETQPNGEVDLFMWKFFLACPKRRKKFPKWEKHATKATQKLMGNNSWLEIALCCPKSIQKEAIKAFQESGIKGKFPVLEIPLLLKELKSNDDSIRERAAARLGDFGSQAINAVPALIRSLGDYNSQVVLYSSDSLWRIGHSSEEVAYLLLQALKKRDRTLRSWIDVTLDRFTIEAKIPALKKILQEKNPYLKKYATDLLNYHGVSFS